MATYRVQDGVLTVGSAIGKHLSGEVTKNAATMESTGGGDEWREFKAGYKSWTAALTARFQGTVPAVGDQATVSMVVNEDDGTTDVMTFSGAGVVTSVRVGGDHEAVYDLAVDVQGSGALTETAGV